MSDDPNTMKELPPKPAPLFARTKVEAVFGSLPYAGKPKTVEEMDAAVAAEARWRTRGARA